MTKQPIEKFESIQALLEDMEKVFHKAPIAFSNPQLPNAPLLTWLTIKGYDVNPSNFAGDWALEIRPIHDKTELTHLEICEDVNVGLRKAIRTMFL